jgi:PAS domain S-box-containing protein
LAPSRAPRNTGAHRFAAVPALLDNAPCGFISLSDKGTIALVNSTLAVMLEHDPRELIGKHVEEIFTKPTKIFFQTHVFPMLRMQPHANELYLTLKKRNGDAIHALANASKRERNGQELVDIVLMQILEREKYEQELLRARRAAEDANRSKVEFLSMMSHDLRTPLNAVNGYADLLLMGVRGSLNEQQTTDVERIKNAGSFLLGLINDVLAFARLELGKAELTIKPVRLDDILVLTEELLMERFRETGILYLRAPVPDEMIVSADPDRLQQILVNLLGNATKFTPAGGRVTVSASRTGDRVSIRVSDTGRGIPREKMEEIFKPFSQVDPDFDKKKGGVGLGLAIGRELARSMDGDLTVTSEPGRGSEFTVTLPSG